MESKTFYRTSKRENGARGRVIVALVAEDSYIQYGNPGMQLPLRPLFLFTNGPHYLGEPHLAPLSLMEVLTEGHHLVDFDFDFPFINGSQALRDSIATPMEFIATFGLQPAAIDPSRSLAAEVDSLSDADIMRVSSPFAL